MLLGVAEQPGYGFCLDGEAMTSCPLWEAPFPNLLYINLVLRYNCLIELATLLYLSGLGHCLDSHELFMKQVVIINHSNVT